MQATEERHLVRRGKGGTYYLRVRIPAHLLDAYPASRREILLSLRTRDEDRARKLLRRELARLDREFEEKSGDLERRRGPRQRVTTLSAEQLRDLGQTWVRAVLETDESIRASGLDEPDFAELGQRIGQQRRELGHLLARGQTARILPAMYSFLHLCGIDARLSAEHEQAAGYAFLEAAVTALDHQAQRHSGRAVSTVSVVGPTTPLVSWRTVFETWRDYVVGRPKTTTIACATAWRQIEAFARTEDVLWPAHVTPATMAGFVDHLRTSSLSAKTVNERLRKIRAVYKVAIGRQVLNTNPAETTLGVKLPRSGEGRNKRLPFGLEDLRAIFGSPVFTHHLRSPGQSGEATYWIPVLMYYTGARPEEVAGLLVDDLQREPKLGWYLHITDMPTDEDADLFGPPHFKPRPKGEGDLERRRLKNSASRRKVPVAPQLVALGLLRYVQWVKDQGQTRLFPTLQPDTHGKLSGAFGKFFGRFKRDLGISSRRTLYSFRHLMKDLLEQGKVPSKYLQRILGHTTGDGTVTDGYGSDLPLHLIFRHFSRVRFADIPAHPWEPGVGSLRRHGREHSTLARPGLLKGKRAKK